ncbi:MAG: sugar phosphate isomerase/epimerase [Victivallaceae bacterium]|nr:sugar phosphate isomerase/epimerase [Victivallaceae bacterium]
MKPELSVQLYSVREDAANDYEAMIRKIAAMGFMSVEPAGFPGSTVEKAAALFKELGLSAPSQHGQLPLGDAQQQIIEEAQMLGIKYIYTGCPPDYPVSFQSTDAIKAVAEQFCEAADYAAQFGIQVGIHNHTFEMLEVEGRPAYEYFLEATPETVLWEADIYWVVAGGRIPAEFIKRLGNRATCLHFKDGTFDANDAVLELKESANGMVAKERKFLPAGAGDVDLLAAFKAVSPVTEYIVVELDSYDGNMMEAVQESYTYLTQSGIATGRV